jgi:hypothetical protein
MTAVRQPEQNPACDQTPDNQIRHPSARALVVPIKRLKTLKKSNTSEIFYKVS